MADVQNYTLGRGKLHFSRFKPGTQTPKGFFYIGNTPEFSLTIESENLPHFSSDRGIREKDDSVPLEVTRTGSMITDNIDPKNVALFFFGDASTVVQVAAVDQSQNIQDVVAGHSYKLGQTTTNPAGYFGISQTGFNVALGGATLVAATGTLTFSGVGTDGDTITISGVSYTLRANPVNPYEVDIGGTATVTAANLVAAINAGAGVGTSYATGTLAHPDVSASNAAGVVTATALVRGTAGNAIATTENGSATAWAAATLTSGTGTSYIEGTDYTMDYDAGVLTIVPGGAIATDTDIDVYFSVRASSRDRVISGSEPVEGALMYIAANPKGKNINYYMPWVKITPNGDYAMKGDEWQQIPFNLECLKPVNSEAIYADGKPVYV
jgi:hypothetical protein